VISARFAIVATVEKKRANAKAAEAFTEKQRADEEAADALLEKQRADEKAADALREKGRADEKAAEALAEKDRADQKAAEAQRQADRAAWQLYLNHIAAAQRGWQTNDIAVAWDHLNACRWDLRGWEHDYLHTLFTRGQITLRGHGKAVTSVAFSPDGQRIVSGSNDDTLKVWDAATGQETFTLKGHKHWVTSVAFSPDGQRIVSASTDSTLKIWDAATGKLVRLFPYGGKLDFSPNGKLIACMASQPIEGDTLRDVRKHYDVQIYELKTGKLMKTLVSDNHTKESYVLWIEFSPDGGLVAAANWEGTAKLWDVATGELVKTITEHNAGVHTTVFAPDGNTMATGGEDKMLRLWTLEQR
jgi:WD40 repeat protein